MRLHLRLELSGLIARVFLLDQLSFLFSELLLDFDDALLFSGGLLQVSLLGVSPLALLVSNAVSFIDHLFLRVARGVPVVRLQFGDLVHGRFASIALVLDVFKQLLLVHTTKFVLNIVAYNSCQERII